MVCSFKPPKLSYRGLMKLTKDILLALTTWTLVLGYRVVMIFDPAGAAEAVNTTLTALMNERMSSAARDAVDALDSTTATLEDLITAPQLT